MASADEAVSEELVAARSQIAVLTFEARDMEAVNRTLLIKVGKLEAVVEKQIQVYLADSKHHWESLQLADILAKDDKKKIDELTKENAELTKELWHEVVGWGVQDCKRRRLK